MPKEIVMRHASPHFLHVFAGDGYSAGYYSYMWSEVLDADGFEAFKEKKDPFDPATAKRLHDFIYSSGGTRDFARSLSPVPRPRSRASTRCWKDGGWRHEERCALTRFAALSCRCPPSPVTAPKVGIATHRRTARRRALSL